MKEKKLYTCEICHTDYAEKSRCAECEKSHKTKLEIKSLGKNLSRLAFIMMASRRLLLLLQPMVKNIHTIVKR